jgi:hypothetical protein
MAKTQCKRSRSRKRHQRGGWSFFSNEPTSGESTINTISTDTEKNTTVKPSSFSVFSFFNNTSTQKNLTRKEKTSSSPGFFQSFFGNSDNTTKPTNHTTKPTNHTRHPTKTTSVKSDNENMTDNMIQPILPNNNTDTPDNQNKSPDHPVSVGGKRGKRKSRSSRRKSSTQKKK